MENMALFLKALHFAADKHRDQRRKGEDASPYINHPIHVAQILTEVVGVEDIGVLCAAVLHDTVEDTETTSEDLEREFGSRIAGIVAEVTDDKGLPKERRKQEQIAHAHFISPEGALVKVADKISNITDVADHPPLDWGRQRRQEYLDWAAEVVANCRAADPGLVNHFEAVLAKSKQALDFK